MVPVPFDPDDVTAADAVLATHEHTDHVHGPSQGPILANTGARFYAPGASLSVVEEADWRGTYDFDDGTFREVTPGDGFAVGAFDVEVVAADDPDAVDPVGYVVDAPGGTFFHGGDARAGEPFERVGREYDLDVGALAFGSTGTIPDKETGDPVETTWYSDEADVAGAARQLQLDRFVPTHWDMWKGLTADPTALHAHVRSFEYPRRLEVVEIGDRFDL
jgi:L-ascorbate 6-phosphate lactonase